MKILSILLLLVLVMAPFVITSGTKPGFRFARHDWLWVIPLTIGYFYILTVLIKFIVTP